MNNENLDFNNPMRLDGRTVVVVGGGSAAPGWSIGRASSVLYARLGAKVCVIDLDMESAAETVRLIHAEGGNAIALEGDMGEEADARRTYAQSKEILGPADVLHYNVGIGKTGGPMETSLADLHRINSINVGGLLLACQEVLPDMLSRQRGVIIGISSIAARQYLGYPHLAYGVTKAAVEQFTKLIALQYAADGIRANSVVPGLIDTPRIAKTVADRYDANSLDSAKQQRAQQVPNKRMGTAWDVAYACAFLASDAAAYINGTELLVDGGLSGKFI